MARKDDLLVGGSETIIGTGVRLKGTLHSEGDISIDGALSGEIKTGGNVSIGVNATVKANIVGDNVRVAGDLEGNITATGETAITETGRVRGNISTASLSIGSGGIFQGASIMTTPEPIALSDAHAEAD